MGILYVCGTPIGNMEDVSIRLLKTLRKVDLIACEDTRHTIKLLNRYKIKNKMISYHEHSSREKENFLIEQLLAGKNIALVSDAGMPGICDPGEFLVKKAIAEGIPIEVIPGPSAVIAALAVSGLDSKEFIFAGFLPERAVKRKQSLQLYVNETRTVIFYEAPHRLQAALTDIETVLGGERKAVVVRELTKKFEDIQRGSIKELKEFYCQYPPRGEICLLVAGTEIAKVPPDLQMIVAEINRLIQNGMDKKEALKIKAREYHIKKAILYQYFVENKD
ncbi:MAG TPA: 16S rRNA (cytidine(1402)-2'-O)-methyltransferase [Syntrophomonadaceae bacterium]|nr:16S rRNA (cytidine(1402)-2'-O)-methyltransferase [Syntrophomonadaceae bacterium]HRX20268.1 16S rRNA (cytidine(1402)-2'-O)-methyltransferase [Syntrophomonadaceae bacterium]